MNKSLTFLMLLFFSNAVFSSQFNLTLENDCLLKHSDNDYSHGTGFEYVSDDRFHFKAGQNMYTPHDLRRTDHIEGDRAYAGYLYGGIGYEPFYDVNSFWTHYAELDVGMIGPSARCEQTQKFIHKILDCREPKGWSNQLHDEFTMNVQWWTKYNWFFWKYTALVPRTGILAGNVQDAVELGCDLKLGWNLEKDVGNTIMFSAPAKNSWKEKLKAYVYCGIDERYYLYNHFYDGSMFNHKDDYLAVDIEPFVFEFRAGAKIQYDKFIVHYYFVLRTDEYENQKEGTDFGGLNFGFIF